jgi:hypothetical protein
MITYRLRGNRVKADDFQWYYRRHIDIHEKIASDASTREF